MKVYKYALEIGDHIKVELPAGAKILCCDWQNGQLMCWALVDPNLALKMRTIRMAGTGYEIEVLPNPLEWRYLNTIQRQGLVWHFFALEVSE